MKSLFKTTAPLASLSEVAGRIVHELPPGFCLWMQGEIGAGKTTLSGALLRKLGLDPRIPVTSPTFTYMNEYQIGDKLYVHWDLYRSEGDFSVEDLGHMQERSVEGALVEWPERLGDPEELRPTHLLKITYLESDAERIYELFAT